MLVRMGLFMRSHMNRPYSYCVHIRGLYNENFKMEFEHTIFVTHLIITVQLYS